MYKESSERPRICALEISTSPTHHFRSLPPSKYKMRVTLRELVESLSKPVEEAAAWALLEESSRAVSLTIQSERFITGINDPNFHRLRLLHLQTRKAASGLSSRLTVSY